MTGHLTVCSAPGRDKTWAWGKTRDPLILRLIMLALPLTSLKTRHWPSCVPRGDCDSTCPICVSYNCCKTLNNKGSQTWAKPVPFQSNLTIEIAGDSLGYTKLNTCSKTPFNFSMAPGPQASDIEVSNIRWNSAPYVGHLTCLFLFAQYLTNKGNY